METPNNRDELLVELKRVLGAMPENGTASMKADVLEAMRAALASGRARIGWLIETDPLNADCLFMTGDKLVPLFVIRSGAVGGEAKSCN
jgi:hypothetical protein